MRPEGAGERRGLAVDHLDRFGEVERTNAVAQQIGALRPALDQRDGEVRAAERDDQPGQSATGTEVDEMRPRAFGRRRRQGSDETIGVCNRVDDGGAADRAASLDLGEDVDEVVVSHSPGR